MKIAILGWGSLIWKPEDLNYNVNFGWSEDGPILPIEFARISKNGRLTLIITDSGTTVQTLYTLSNHDDLDLAIEDLRHREGTNINNIGYYDKSVDKLFPTDFEYEQNILDWINDKDIDAVIWTNLPENWMEKTTDRIEYLKSLEGYLKEISEEYIIKTPKVIKTKLRLQIENELNWK